MRIIDEPARDVVCQSCGEFYEVKASRNPAAASAAAGAVSSYELRFKTDPPNLVLITYRTAKEVFAARRATVVPRTVVDLSPIQAKPPSTLHTGRVVRLCSLRHALYAALLAKNNGAGFARAHLHAHEQDNDAWFSFGSDGGCKGDQLRRDTEADKINTEIGISFGEGYKGKDKTLISNMVYAARTNLDGWAGFDYGSPCG